MAWEYKGEEVLVAHKIKLTKAQVKQIEKQADKQGGMVLLYHNGKAVEPPKDVEESHSCGTVRTVVSGCGSNGCGTSKPCRSSCGSGEGCGHSRSYRSSCGGSGC